MTSHRKKCPHMVHFKVPRDWFETNSRHQKHYSKGGKKNRGCRGLLGRVIVLWFDCHLCCRYWVRALAMWKTLKWLIFAWLSVLCLAALPLLPWYMITFTLFQFQGLSLLHVYCRIHSKLYLFIKGQVALENNFRFVLDKSDLKSASTKKIVQKATVALEIKSVNKASRHVLHFLRSPACFSGHS